MCKGCSEIALENAKGEVERDAKRAEVASQATRSVRRLLEDWMDERELRGSFAEVWD